MDAPEDPRLIRLLDLREGEMLAVTCPCGQIGLLTTAQLYRWHRVAGDTLVSDLRHLLRCRRCRRRDGIGIRVEASVPDGQWMRREVRAVVVPGPDESGTPRPGHPVPRPPEV